MAGKSDLKKTTKKRGGGRNLEAQAKKEEGAMNVSFVVGIHRSVNLDGIFLK